MLSKNILLLVIVAILSSNVNVYAQNKNIAKNPVFNSPQGPVLLFGATSINNRGMDAHGTKFTISRTGVADNQTKQLNLPGMVSNFSSFKKIVGVSIVQQLEKQLKLKNEDDLWKFIRQHSELSEYGLIALNIPFRLAMGAAYVDEEIKDQKGKTFSYTISISGNNQNNVSKKAIVTIGSIPDFATPKVMQAKSGDSTVNIKWSSTFSHDVPYFAFVFRQTAGRGEFHKLPVRILAIHKKDSAYFLFSEKVNGNSAYRYFIRPADLLDNEGTLNSDTANVVAVDYRKLPVISSVKTADTLNGILLTWKRLPENVLLTGIEIQRSRDSRGDYVAIDTISALSDSYLDKRLLPHTAYYYRLCVLHAGNSPKEKYYTKASMAKQKSDHVPDAPYGLNARTTEKGVHISWKPVNDFDLYAYYVYRGTSMNSKMEIISPSLMDTVFDDNTSNMSRQLDYVYAVKAVSNAGKASSFSEKIAARLPEGKERPLTPGGIRVVRTNDHLRIEWEDVMKNDPTILGYILYKHEKENTRLQYAIDKPASVEATRLKLTPVVNGVITVPYFEDTISDNGKRYEYLVSVIDKFGVESGLSSIASSPSGIGKMISPPAQVFARSVKDGVALQWEQPQQQQVKSFIIYRRLINEKSFKQIAVLKSTVSNYIDKLPQHNSLYVYTVAAELSNGEIEKSAEKSVRR